MNQQAVDGKDRSSGRTAVPNSNLSPTQRLAPAGVVEALREATTQSHRRLEALPAQKRLLRADYTLTEYRLLIERLYGFYQPLADALQNHAFAARWASRIAVRAQLLFEDLLDLGLTPAGLAQISRCDKLPALDTVDRALGCAYVLEGSTLGGRVIFQHLAGVFPDRAAVSLRFFAGDGELTAQRWHQFCAVLNAEAVDTAAVCDAARGWFDAMAAWLADSVPVRVENRA